MATGGLYQLRRRIKANRLAVEERRTENRLVVALEPRGDVDKQRKARCMRLGKTTFAEAEDLLVQAIGGCGAVAVAQHACLQLGFEMLEPAALFPRSHRAEQAIG